MSTPVDEYESEPVRGLPEALPEGEQILWQGSPRWTSLARRAFHARKLAVYFAALAAWRIASALPESPSPVEAIASAVPIVALASLALGIVALLAFANARATVYTITNRRVVMRFGVAVPLAVNLPFRSIRSAGVEVHGDGTADIALAVTGADRIGHVMLWPHVRPWSFGRDVQPMLRTVPDGAEVARILARSLAASETRAGRWPAPDPHPQRRPSLEPGVAAAAS